MGKELKRISFFAAVIILLAFVLFVANQTSQFVALVSAYNPLAGQVTLYCLLVVYALLIAAPCVMYVRLPRAIRPPADRNSSEYQEYLIRLRARLASNRNLKGQAIALKDQAGIEAAVRLLDAKADKSIRNIASALFVSTAVSQNGRLDGLMVLVAQSRMVWQIAHIYNQRPAPAEIVRLYANVAVSAFASVQIEDLDIGEQVHAVIAPAIATSAVSAVPGVSAVSAVLTHALVEGSANAFLTVRVGIIAKRYCSPLAPVDRSVLRRLASAEAARVLGAILVDSGAVVSKAMVGAVIKAGRGALSRPAGATRDTIAAALGTLSNVKDKTASTVRKSATRGPEA